MKSDITVCIPHLPERRDSLLRCVDSVLKQTLLPDSIIIEVDNSREGAAVVRNRALSKVSTSLVAWVDDDDTIYPQHLESLSKCINETGSSLCYPWFDLFVMNELRNDKDPLSINGVSPFGLPFDSVTKDWILTKGNFIPVTVLAKTESVLKAGGFQPHPQATPDNDLEDWGLWIAMLGNGAVFAHVPIRTWAWHHTGHNTAGKARKWG